MDKYINFNISGFKSFYYFLFFHLLYNTLWVLASSTMSFQVFAVAKKKWTEIIIVNLNLV
jgi:hypothetical protein